MTSSHQGEMKLLATFSVNFPVLAPRKVLLMKRCNGNFSSEKNVADADRERFVTLSKILNYLRPDNIMSTTEEKVVARRRSIGGRSKLYFL